MELSVFDILSFILFFTIVIGVSMYKSRKEESGEDFFLAGRGLLWPMIGIALIAANISTEQIVGMAGQGSSSVGLAIASYEWMAAFVSVGWAVEAWMTISIRFGPYFGYKAPHRPRY